MKIARVWCPREGIIADRDHFEKECTALPMPLQMIRRIMAANEGDVFHSAGRMTATRLLTCPREVVILDTLGVTFNPCRSHASFIGTQVHKALEEGAKPGEYGEIDIPPTIFFAGTPYEIQIEGKVDRVSPSLEKVVDYKFHGDRTYWYQVREGGSKPEYRVQLSIYKFGIERTTGVEVKELGIWHGAMTAAEMDGGVALPWFYTPIEPMTEDEILKVRPHDDTGAQPYSVGDLILQYKAHYARVKGGLMTTEASIKAMPLVGRKMFGGKKCSRYCSAQYECDQLEGIRW